MSNQRRGNWKPAAMNDSSRIDAMSLTTFCKHAKVILEERGEEDAAFYFGQVKIGCVMGEEFKLDTMMLPEFLVCNEIFSN